jgi:hypothetical protein
MYAAVGAQICGQLCVTLQAAGKKFWTIFKRTVTRDFPGFPVPV